MEDLKKYYEICDFCGKGFELRRNKIGKLISKQRYCNQSCADKKYYENNKDKLRSRIKKWQDENPEKVKKHHSEVHKRNKCETKPKSI